MIQTNNLSIKYESHKIKFPDINLNSGDSLLILGKSGSGKTSMLNLLGGLASPNSGTVCINSQIIHSLTSNQIDKFRGSNIGFVFQTPHFIKSLSVQENLELTQYLVGETHRHYSDRLLKKVGLLNRKNDSVNTLSEGEKQRISIVRALINQPKVILADEPTSALDDESCNEVISLLKELSLENQAVLIIVTHDKRLKKKFTQFIDLDDT